MKAWPHDVVYHVWYEMIANYEIKALEKTLAAPDQVDCAKPWVAMQ